MILIISITFVNINKDSHYFHLFYLNKDFGQQKLYITFLQKKEQKVKFLIRTANKQSQYMAEQQLQKHKYKWKMWSEGFARQEIKQKMKIEEGMQNYAVNLIEKIKDPSCKNDKKISKQIGNQIESNVCGICLQLMVPPDHHPIIIIPCGHNVCKDCIYMDNQNLYTTTSKPRLRLNKCPICRTGIQSHALNRTLMTLICSYTNNKQLLEKQLQKQQEDASSGDNMQIEKLRMRCEILQREKTSLSKTVKSFKHEKDILQQVIQTLKKEKKRNEQQMQRLQAQAKLINRHLGQKFEQLTLVENKMDEAVNKQKIVDRTLKPLLQQKQKQQILQVAKMLQQKNPM